MNGNACVSTKISVYLTISIICLDTEIHRTSAVPLLELMAAYFLHYICFHWWVITCMHSTCKILIRMFYKSYVVWVVAMLYGFLARQNSRGASSREGGATYICISKSVSNETIICLDQSPSPVPCQSIIWSNAGVLLISRLWTYFDKNCTQWINYHTRKWIGKFRQQNILHFVWVCAD